jgi:hypothetical protein
MTNDVIEMLEMLKKKTEIEQSLIQGMRESMDSSFKTFGKRLDITDRKVDALSDEIRDMRKSLNEIDIDHKQCKQMTEKRVQDLETFEDRHTNQHIECEKDKKREQREESKSIWGRFGIFISLGIFILGMIISIVVSVNVNSVNTDRLREDLMYQKQRIDSRDSRDSRER